METIHVHTTVFMSMQHLKYDCCCCFSFFFIFRPLWDAISQFRDVISSNIGAGVLHENETLHHGNLSRLIETIRSIYVNYMQQQLFQLKFSSLSVRHLTPIFLALAKIIIQAKESRYFFNSQSYFFQKITFFY